MEIFIIAIVYALFVFMSRYLVSKLEYQFDLFYMMCFVPFFNIMLCIVSLLLLIMESKNASNNKFWNWFTNNGKKSKI